MVVCTTAHAQITVGSQMLKRLGVVLEKSLESPEVFVKVIRNTQGDTGDSLYFLPWAGGRSIIKRK